MTKNERCFEALQRDLEHEAISQGIEDVLRDYQGQSDDTFGKSYSDSGRWSKLRQSFIHKMADEVESFMSAVTGENANTFRAIKDKKVSGLFLCLLADKMVLDAALKHSFKDRTVAGISDAIGSELNTIMMHCEVAQVYPWIIDSVWTNDTELKTLGIKKRAKREGLDLVTVLGSADRKKIGGFLIRRYAQFSGIIDITRHRLPQTSSKAPKETYILSLKPEWAEEISNTAEVVGSLSSVRPPMVVPPAPWKLNQGDLVGGYKYDLAGWSPFVSGRSNSKQTKWIDMLPGHRQTPLDALNILGRVPWRICQPVLEVYSEALDGNYPIKGFVPRDSTPPPVAASHDVSPEELESLKKRKKHYHSNEQKRISQYLSQLRLCMEAKKQSKHPAIYFPHHFDFRSRLYPLTSTPLSFQKDSAAKALLEFKDGKRLTEEGAKWLAIHGANVYGEDKGTLNQRLQWVHDNEEMILRCAKHKLECREWFCADKPWLFLQFCFEWQTYLADPESFESRIPVQIDASCSGTQHTAAIMRNKDDAKLVNLYQEKAEHPTAKAILDELGEEAPSDLFRSLSLPSSVCPEGWDGLGKQDLYGAVRDDLLERLEEASRECPGSIEEGLLEYQELTAQYEADNHNATVRKARQQRCKSLFAKLWLSLNLIDRSFMKGPVMTIAYGASNFGLETDIKEQLIEADLSSVLEGKESLLHGITKTDMANFLAELIFQSVDKITTSSSQVRDFVSRVGDVCGKYNAPLSWRTPTGFVVTVDPPKQTSRKIKPPGYTPACSFQRLNFKFPDESGKLDKPKMGRSAPPNFIHSLDASHMMLTLVELEKIFGHGLSVASIHDCIALPANLIPVARDVLQSTFRGLYGPHKRPLRDFFQYAGANALMSLIEQGEGLESPRFKGLEKDLKKLKEDLRELERHQEEGELLLDGTEHSPYAFC